MKERWLQGSLSNTPFSQLLFRIWQKEKSGYLKIKNDKLEKRLYFKKGNITIERASFPQQDFLRALVEREILDSSSAEECESFAVKNKTTLIKALHELGLFSPSRLWQLMEIFIKSEFFPLFDCFQAEYILDPADILQESEALFIIPTLNFILQGVRQMQNNEIIKAHIPPENKTAQIFSPCYLNQIKLESPEKYLLNLIDDKKNLKNIYDLSELGKKESEKIIFGLFSLGIIGFPKRKVRENLPCEFSQLEFGKILDAFNNKCSYIYKYISKELGPVALNVIEKSLEEIKPYLSPLFQKIEFGSDGKVDRNSILKTNITLLKEGTKKNFIRDLNEILAAEILAVKKTLGNEHESVLVKNLEKTGEPN